MWKSIRPLLPVLIPVAFLFLFFLVLPAFGDREEDRVHILANAQFAIKAAAQVAGLVITLACLLVLTGPVLTGEPAGDRLAAALCVLGGVLLFEPHWASAVMFGLLALAPAIERLITSCRNGRSSAGPQTTGVGSSIVAPPGGL